MALRGNTNRLGQRWKIPKHVLAKGNSSWFKVGQVSPFKGKKRPEFTGENNPNWLSDRTLLKKKQERNDSAYHEWRKEVWSRDKWMCQIANADCEGRIEAHHILAWRDYPELRYQINNGITLCHAHHPRMRSEEKRLIPEFQALVSVSKA